jgi:DNA-directed RNA polymerase subunit RPC12/RpoP
MPNGFEREDGMALINRKQSEEDVAVRCPKCDERVPDGARRCTMCGHRLADVATEATRERADDAQAR